MAYITVVFVQYTIYDSYTACNGLYHSCISTGYSNGHVLQDKGHSLRYFPK